MVATTVGNSPPRRRRPGKTRGLADAGAPHAVAGVHRPEIQTQGVAADVAGEDAPGKAVLMA